MGHPDCGRPDRHAATDARRAAPDPRGARPRRGLHEVALGADPRGPVAHHGAAASRRSKPWPGIVPSVRPVAGSRLTMRPPFRIKAKIADPSGATAIPSTAVPMSIRRLTARSLVAIATMPPDPAAQTVLPSGETTTRPAGPTPSCPNLASSIDAGSVGPSDVDATDIEPGPPAVCSVAVRLTTSSVGSISAAIPSVALIA